MSNEFEIPTGQAQRRMSVGPNTTRSRPRPDQEKATRPNAEGSSTTLSPDLETDPSAADKATPGKDGVADGSAPQYSQEELMAVFDQLMFQGYYEEDYRLHGGRLLVKFRTRTAEQSDEVAYALDTAKYTLAATLAQHKSKLDLTYALVRYHDKDLSNWKIEDREAFVSKLATPVVWMLVETLAKFDSKVYKACEGADKNF